MAKKKHHEEHENLERWLVSYADFITLLFAFFTVLYATSQKDISKAKELEQSVRRAFSHLDFGGVQGQYADEKGGSLIPPPMELFPPQGAKPSDMQEAVEKLVDKTMSKEEQEQAGLEIRHDSYGVHLSMAASAIFPSGSDRILKDAVSSLSKVARILKLTERKIIVEGHTDNQPLSTSQFPSNWELSAARATRIVRYLIRHHQIEENRLVVIAYADQKPIATNSTSEGRAKNRRIEILIVTGEWNP